MEPTERIRELRLTDDLKVRGTRRSLADQVAESLSELILQRGLRAGDAIPSTGDLADAFGVSRTVVREAIADLAGRGILRRSQGRECIVNVPGSDALEKVLAFHVRYDSLGVMDVQEIREAIEVRAARLAATRRTTEQLDEIREHFETLASLPPTPESDEPRRNADVAFHRAIAQASGNLLFGVILDALGPMLRESLSRAAPGLQASGETLEGLVQAHRRILQSIEASNSDAAADAMERHLRQTREGLRALQERDGAAGWTSSNPPVHWSPSALE